MAANTTKLIEDIKALSEALDENVFIEKYVDFPSPDDVFDEGDVLVMVGSDRAISEVERFFERGE